MTIKSDDFEQLKPLVTDQTEKKKKRKENLSFKVQFLYYCIQKLVNDIKKNLAMFGKIELCQPFVVKNCQPFKFTF